MWGVNKYQTQEPSLTNTLRVDPKQARRQLERLNRVRTERDTAAMEASLRRLEEVARGTDNTVPAILECVEAYASIGEICDVFRSVFGEQKEFSSF